MILAFESAVKSTSPFPHFRVSEILPNSAADQVLRWFEDDAPWKLTIADFYEQYEFSLLNASLAPGVDRLVEDGFVANIAENLERSVSIDGKLELADITAHKLVAGQTIRIHNDFIGPEETHRLLIQINSGWTARQGGLLMLFGSDQPESLQSVLLPSHGSGFAFEISPVSFHAVSSINSGERYTLVYTFRKRS